jgi:hypothetical protein
MRTLTSLTVVTLLTCAAGAQEIVAPTPTVVVVGRTTRDVVVKPGQTTTITLESWRGPGNSPVPDSVVVAVPSPDLRKVGLVMDVAISAFGSPIVVQVTSSRGRALRIPAGYPIARLTVVAATPMYPLCGVHRTVTSLRDSCGGTE